MSSNPPGSMPGNPIQGAMGSNATANRASVANPPAAQHGAGRKPCQYFNRSRCKFGTRCRDLHVRTPEGDAGPSFGPHPARINQGSRKNFPGLSNDHFSTVALNYTAGKTSTVLQTYVADSFQFQIPDQIYTFLNLLCAASSQNKANWTDKEAQTHLHNYVLCQLCEIAVTKTSRTRLGWRLSRW